MMNMQEYNAYRYTQTATSHFPVKASTMTFKTDSPVVNRKPLPTGWRSMRSAPRDGTMILVCESPNGEHYNVMPASYQLHLGEALMEGFWGVWPTSRLPPHLHHERGQAALERGLPADFKALAITPLCWQPMPACESIEKLRRRAAQVYAAKSRARQPIAPVFARNAPPPSTPSSPL